MLRVLIVTLALLGLTLPAQASELPLEEWLDEPDVKLVAVEFYADWCEPCKKAAPKWEAFRKKYAPLGLKLVVVNLSESPGAGKRCTRLPWNPDESICDPELGEKLGVTDLPEAFVWSWQGNMLVDRGKHVDEIERVIRRYLDDNPRVAVVATNPQGEHDRELQRMVEAKLDEAGKLSIVADAKTRTRLSKVRKESHGADRRDEQRSRLGGEISANSLLMAERFKGSLSLTLNDANTGCQLATTHVDWTKKRAQRAVNKAVYKLMASIKRREVVMPAQYVAHKRQEEQRRRLSEQRAAEQQRDAERRRQEAEIAELQRRLAERERADRAVRRSPQSPATGKKPRWCQKDLRDHSENDQLVCRSPGLWGLEERNVALYFRLKANAPSSQLRDAMKADLSAWLTQRNGCRKSLACTTRSYELRIAALERLEAQMNGGPVDETTSRFSPSRPHLVIACSSNKRKANGRSAAQRKVDKLQRAGFRNATVADGEQFPNFGCCYWSCVVDAFASKDDAKALVEEVKAAGFKAYAKRGWR